ncbi:MAG TPA: transposase, partial [Flavobacteriaceae bacterium]|nr:transposase [Flavobacteriaceae bacterium]
MSLFYKIHLGSMIHKRVDELDYSTEKLCKFLKLTNAELLEIYKKESLESNLILKFSKLLDYDFFRIYSQHLILYSAKENKSENNIKSKLPNFKKNVYTHEIIDYILSKINS